LFFTYLLLRVSVSTQTLDSYSKDHGSEIVLLSPVVLRTFCGRYLDTFFYGQLETCGSCQCQRDVPAIDWTIPFCCSLSSGYWRSKFIIKCGEETRNQKLHFITQQIGHANIKVPKHGVENGTCAPWRQEISISWPVPGNSSSNNTVVFIFTQNGTTENKIFTGYFQLIQVSVTLHSNPVDFPEAANPGMFCRTAFPNKSWNKLLTIGLHSLRAWGSMLEVRSTNELIFPSRSSVYIGCGWSHTVGRTVDSFLLLRFRGGDSFRHCWGVFKGFACPSSALS